MSAARQQVGRWAPLSLALALLAGCAAPGPEAGSGATGPEAVARDLDPPAAPGAFAPRLVAAEGELLLTWWEPLEPATGERAHRLMFSRFTEVWSPPSVIVAGDRLFANWADFPAIAREPSGGLLVSWLAKTGNETYAYSVELARSSDDGLTWQPLGRLNDDATDTEHGFVSFVPEGAGIRAFWLDGREMATGGPMTARTALIEAAIGPSELLDERVCECCPTDAVATGEGAWFVYRDRGADETRDIFAVGRSAQGWSEPRPVTADAWRIPGCPVNGPAADHRDGQTAVAWFTGADAAPRVVAGFGREAARRMVVVDGDRPLGRVGLALDADGSAVVSWLALAGEEAELRLRRVVPGGTLGEALVLGRTSAARASGIPQLEERADRFYLAWVEDLATAPPRLRVREIAAAGIPAAAPAAAPG